MNRVKLTIRDEGGNTLCKIGTSIEPPIGLEYNDKEIADALDGMADILRGNWAWREQRVSDVVEKWADVLNAESSGLAKVMLLEAQERPYEM
jgi:hypothetical protein